MMPAHQVSPARGSYRPAGLFARVTAGPELDFSLDTLFDFGLRCVLDGIRVLIDDRTAGRPR